MRQGWAALLAACIACGGRTELDGANDAGLVSDGGGIVDSAPSCDPSARFGQPTPLDAINTPFEEFDFRLTPDELTAYFSSDRPFDAGPNASPLRIYVAKRASMADPFGGVEMNFGLTEPNSGADSPNISADEHLILYAFGCGPGALQQATLWLCQSTRKDTTSAFSIGTQVFVKNNPLITGAPYMLPDGLAIYFPAAGLPGRGIAVSRRTNLDPSFGPATKVTINGIIEDATHVSSASVVTPDERLLFFSWPDTDSSHYVEHIWQASRASTHDPFGSAAIVAELSSPFGEIPTWVSPDGCRLYFARYVSQTNTDIFVASRPLKN